ncbi:MAG TPA: hypothetical protein VGK73_08995 [Polyangiaceae bacterium]
MADRYPSCRCVNVAPGSYDVAITVVPPAQMAARRRAVGKGVTVQIDSCILAEVTLLWSIGILTLESCCGHGRQQGYLAVYPESSERMLRMGYLVDETGPDGCFIPRGVDSVTGELGAVDDGAVADQMERGLRNG